METIGTLFLCRRLSFDNSLFIGFGFDCFSVSFDIPVAGKTYLFRVLYYGFYIYILFFFLKGRFWGAKGRVQGFRVPGPRFLSVFGTFALRRLHASARSSKLLPATPNPTK